MKQLALFFLLGAGLTFGACSRHDNGSSTYQSSTTRTTGYSK